MADTQKLTTLAQAQEIANAVIGKVSAKGYAVAANLGALASKDEVAETDLASALASKINGKQDPATTLAGYGITDAYTKTEVDNAIAEAESSLLKPGGSLAASGIVSALLVEGNLGKVYNITEDFTTTSDFVEGAGKVHPAGTNIYIVDASSTTTPDYKFDVLAGAYGVATQSGNGLMSASDKTKLDNADVTAYTGSGAVDITNHVVSVAAASASTSGVGGNAGTMSAADKEKLDSFTVATTSEVEAVIAALDNL